jgi:hypothetical protein
MISLYLVIFLVNFATAFELIVTPTTSIEEKIKLSSVRPSVHPSVRPSIRPSVCKEFLPKYIRY